MAFTLSTTWATTKKNFLGGNGGLSGDIILTFPIVQTAVFWLFMINIIYLEKFPEERIIATN